MEETFLRDGGEDLFCTLELAREMDLETLFFVGGLVF